MLVALTAYAVDQVTRRSRSPSSTAGRTCRWSASCCSSHLVRNPGAAFSLGTGLTPVLSAWRPSPRRSRCCGSRAAWAAPPGRWPSGSCSPASPATSPTGWCGLPGPFRGHVIDFLRLPNWPIFNVADICINMAAGLIILQALRGVRLDGTRERSRSDDDEASAPADADGTSVAGAADVSQSDYRSLHVPEGSAGERVDSAIAQMFGLSRTRSADLIGRGPRERRRRRCQQERAGAARRAARGDHPGRGRPAAGRARGRRGHRDHPRRRLDRGDRQAGGRRGPPLAGLVRPDRRRAPRRRRLPDRHERGLRAPGHRAAPRRRHVGRHGDLQVRARLLGAQERLPPPHGRQDLPRRGAGPPRPARGHHRRPDRAPPGRRLQVRRARRRPRQRHPLRDPRGAPLRQPARGAPRDRPHPPDPGAHGGAEAPVRRRPDLRRRPDARQAVRGHAAVAARRQARASSTPTPAPTSSTSRPTPTTSPRRSMSSATPTDLLLRPRHRRRRRGDRRRPPGVAGRGRRAGTMPPGIHTDERGARVAGRPARGPTRCGSPRPRASWWATCG